MEIARAKADGREPKLRQPPEPKGKLSWCWSMALPHVKNVLADPGKYHPGYDPDAGYEIAGMVWFQGYSDAGNKAYGEQLVEMITWFRNEINAPDMPVVAGTMGVGGYNHTAYSGAVNSGMVYASQVPALKGTVDVVNTARFFPGELGLLINCLHTYDKDSPEYYKIHPIHLKANSNAGFHYYGSAKFFLLAGDAMARSLVNLMKGGMPMVERDPFARPVIDQIMSGEPLEDDEINEEN
jgi:alpha-galactosidase